MIRRRARTAALVLVLTGGMVSSLAALGAPRPARAAASARWGIDQLRIRRTADGHMLDLRYRVVNPERARSLLVRGSAVRVVRESSGERLSVASTPKAGALRTTGVPRAGRSYFALFWNPGGRVQSGERVSIALGELTATLMVE